VDRNEIALRFAVATAQAQAMTNNGTIVKSEIMPNAFDLADAFMDLAERIDARPVKSGPCPGEDARDDAEARKRIDTPVAPKSEAAKYEPRPGDLVTWGSCTAVWRVEWVDSAGVHASFAEKRNYHTDSRYLAPSECETLRLATDDEKDRAGLPSPEATRPTWVKVIGDVSYDSRAPRRVLRWQGGRPIVGSVSAPGLPVSEWEPFCVPEDRWVACDQPPAPVEPAKGEAVKYLHLLRHAHGLMMGGKSPADPEQHSRFLNEIDSFLKDGAP
jgi:hypothetical protein